MTRQPMTLEELKSLKPERSNPILLECDDGRYDETMSVVEE